MRLLPKTTAGVIDFLRTRLPIWAQDPGAIGLTPAEVAALQALVDDAAAARLAAAEARQAALAATARLHQSAAAMRAAASTALSRIKAAASADPGGGGAVYDAAHLPRPARPSPAPPPGTPTRFTVELHQSGSLTLRWRCTNPPGTQGTLYEVQRFLGPPGRTPPEFLGITGAKAFTDTTLPPAAAIRGPITYQVTAVRSTARGNPARYIVAFGAASAAPAEPAERLRAA